MSDVIRVITPRAVPRPWGGTGLPRYNLPGGDAPVGEWWVPTDDYPLLAKVIDARENLSIQLHPDDALARQMGEANGKTEAWYILDHAPGAKILIGLRDDVTDADFLDAAERGEDVSSLLLSFEPKKGDVVFVPPGTIHAICAGVVLLEIQQISDVTFRVFDWNREPARQLHLAESRRAIKRDDRAGLSQRVGSELLSCDEFRISELQVRVRTEVPTADAPELWFCTAGAGTIDADGGDLDVAAGSFVLIPRHAPTPVVIPTHASIELIRMVPNS